MSIFKLIRWSPRIISVLLILLLMMFSLDVFESDLTWYDLIFGLFIHNIPTIILILTLIIAWKRPLIGAVVYIFAGTFYSIWMLSNQGFNQWLAVLSLGVPSIIVGILFYMDYKLL